MDDLAAAIARLADSQSQTNDALAKLADIQVSAHGSAHSTRRPVVVGAQQDTDDSDLQALAQQIKEKYRNVVLDNDHKLHEDRSGVKREDQRLVNVLAKCGRFVETGLRVLAHEQLEDGTLTEVKTSEIHTLLLSQLAYLHSQRIIL